MDLDKYLDRQYDLQNYNCGHFVSEVWRDLTGETIDEIFQALTSNNNNRILEIAKERIKLKKPESPCVCFMQSQVSVPHAGVYVDGKVIHLTEQGVKIEDIHLLKVYFRLSFYK